MINSVLVLVPHQDDDLNVAGSLLDQMKEAGIHIFVCFVTNGDYDRKENIRANEVKKVAKLFGYEKIYYLGYGDGGIYQESLYFAHDYTSVITSHAGYSETHGVSDFCDFHFEKYGQHAAYTKYNLLTDIKDLCLHVLPDLIFCVAQDSHPDHKLVSDLFDEALAQIVEETDYRPLVLKKFAYLGTWHGRDDYFIRPMLQTECFAKKKDLIIQNAAPYSWEKRICFKVLDHNYPLMFWRSPLFQAYRSYKSQNGAVAFTHCCNADAVYWFLDTTKREESMDFPISETPFSYYEDNEKSKQRIFHFFFYAVFKFYVLFIYKFLPKIIDIL